MTEQEYKEICAEIQNSGIPVPSQQKIIDACGKQVGKKPIYQTDKQGLAHEKCPDCESFCIGEYCIKCGKLIDWSDEE